MDKIAQLPLPSVEEIQHMVREALENFLPGEVPAFAKGVVKASVKGWCRVEYYDALTGSQFSFYEAPTVVAVALTREGSSRLVTAPVISIPLVELPDVQKIIVSSIKLPAAPKIPVPSIKLPTPAEITITKPAIPFINIGLPGFTAGEICLGPYCATIGWTQTWADALNAMVSCILSVQSRINDAIYAINKEIAAAYDTIANVKGEIDDFASKSQAAFDSYSGKIKESVDEGLADLKSKTEVVLNEFRSNVEATMNKAMADFKAKTEKAFIDYRDNIQSSVNAGLSQFIPTFYDMMGLPPPAVSPEEQRKLLREIGDVNGDGKIDVHDVGLIQRAIGMSPRDPRFGLYDLNRDGVIDESDVAIVSKNFGKTVVPPRVQLFSPAQLRNVTKDSFEFYGLSAGMQLSYVAIGRR